MAEHEKKLVDQSEALSDFFESLMRDVDAYQEPESADQASRKDNDRSTNEGVTEPEGIQAEARHEIHGAHEPKAEKQTITTEADNKLFEVLPPVMPEPVVIEEIKPTVEISPAIPTPEPIKEPGLGSDAEELPDWCQHEFQAMLFKVAGLTLAVPLVDLNGVVECNLDNISAMPGHADFYLGLMKHLDKNVPLVDTARFVLPADKLSALAGDDPVSRITRAVMIQDCQYGLACDQVNEVVTLSPDEVRWRSQRTQRRWLAGTVVEHMCALIDATAFAELLADGTPIQGFRE